MSVFFSLGQVKLLEAEPGNDFTQCLGQKCRRKRDRAAKIVVIFRHCREIELKPFPLEFIELIIDEGARKLAGPVCSEIKENDRVTVVDLPDGSTIFFDDHREHELIGD